MTAATIHHHVWTLKASHTPMTSSFEPQADYACECGLHVTISSGIVHSSEDGKRIALYYKDWEKLYGNSPYADLVTE